MNHDIWANRKSEHQERSECHSRQMVHDRLADVAELQQLA